MKRIQDVDDYIGNVALASVDGEEAVASARDAQRRRQINFLKRTGTRETNWRPKKIHRKFACHWLSSLHLQITKFIDSGLLFFSQPSDEQKRGLALLWPRLSISLDLGSDGMSAISYGFHVLRGGSV